MFPEDFEDDDPGAWVVFDAVGHVQHFRTFTEREHFHLGMQEQSKHAIENLWPKFTDETHKRLIAGATEYGDKSFSRSPEELLGEIQQELQDVCGWSFILWCRLEAIKKRIS